MRLRSQLIQEEAEAEFAGANSMAGSESENEMEERENESDGDSDDVSTHGNNVAESTVETSEDAETNTTNIVTEQDKNEAGVSTTSESAKAVLTSIAALHTVGLTSTVSPARAIYLPSPGATSTDDVIVVTHTSPTDSLVAEKPGKRRKIHPSGSNQPAVTKTPTKG